MNAGTSCEWTRGRDKAVGRLLGLATVSLRVSELPELITTKEQGKLVGGGEKGPSLQRVQYRGRSVWFTCFGFNRVELRKCGTFVLV